VRESGQAVLAQASPKAYQAEGKAQLLPGIVRSYPALAEGRIFLRNETTLAAYSIAA